LSAAKTGARFISIMNQSASDCVIVGGGIGGAVLALALAQTGKRITLVEKDLHPPKAGRPEILASATLNTFNQLGVGECMMKEAAIPLKGLQLWRSESRRLILEFKEEDLLRAEVQPYSTNPARTRQILLKAAEKFPSITIKRGVDITELLYDHERVIGVGGICGQESIQFRSNLVVGDDGSHSRIRKNLGIHLKLQDFPLLFLGASGVLLSGQSENIGQAWINPKKIKNGLFGGIFMPQPDRRSAFVFLMTKKTYEHFLSVPTQFYEAARHLSPLCEEMEKRYQFPGDFHLFERPFGHSKKYVFEGAALIGDAAHPLTPAGGQGANTSVADAISLAHHIGQDLKAYERERWPANQRSVQISVRADRVLRLLLLFPFLSPFLFFFLKYVDQNDSLKRRFLKTISRTFLSQKKSV